jgi:hypothetical protein
VGVVNTIAIIVVPCRVAIDEASNCDGTQLDEAKKEEQVKPSFLPFATRSGRLSHCKQSVFLKCGWEDWGEKEVFFSNMHIYIDGNIVYRLSFSK